MASLSESVFQFRRRTGAIDWSAIARVDVSRIFRDNDVGALQSLVDMVTFADVEREATRGFGGSVDAGFVKLLQLAQLMIEYLHASQSRLATHLKATQARCSELLRESSARAAVSDQREADARMLKREVRQLKKTIETLETALRIAAVSGQQMVFTPQMPVSPPSCPLCKKQFRNVDFLRSHVERRHPAEKDSEVVANALKAASQGGSKTGGLTLNFVTPAAQPPPAPQVVVLKGTPPPPPEKQEPEQAKESPELKEIRSEMQRLSELKSELSEQVRSTMAEEREKFMREREEQERSAADQLMRIQSEIKKAQKQMHRDQSALKPRSSAPAKPQRQKEPVKQQAEMQKQQPQPAPPAIGAERVGVLETDTEQELEPDVDMVAAIGAAGSLKKRGTPTGGSKPAGSPEAAKKRKKAAPRGTKTPIAERPYLESLVELDPKEVDVARSKVRTLVERTLDQLAVPKGRMEAAQYDRLIEHIKQKRNPVLVEARQQTELMVERITQEQYISKLERESSPMDVPMSDSATESPSVSPDMAPVPDPLPESKLPASSVSHPNRTVPLRSSLSASVSALISSLRAPAEPPSTPAAAQPPLNEEDLRKSVLTRRLSGGKSLPRPDEVAASSPAAQPPPQKQQKSPEKAAAIPATSPGPDDFPVVQNKEVWAEEESTAIPPSVSADEEDDSFVPSDQDVPSSARSEEEAKPKPSASRPFVAATPAAAPTTTATAKKAEIPQPKKEVPPPPAAVPKKSSLKQSKTESGSGGLRGLMRKLSSTFSFGKEKKKEVRVLSPRKEPPGQRQRTSSLPSKLEGKDEKREAPATSAAAMKGPAESESESGEDHTGEVAEMILQEKDDRLMTPVAKASAIPSDEESSATATETPRSPLRRAEEPKKAPSEKSPKEPEKLQAAPTAEDTKMEDVSDEGPVIQSDEEEGSPSPDSGERKKEEVPPSLQSRSPSPLEESAGAGARSPSPRKEDIEEIGDGEIEEVDEMESDDAKGEPPKEKTQTQVTNYEDWDT